MKPSDTLLSRARVYLKNRAGRTALAAAPLATLGLAAADSAKGDTAIFDPAATFTYGDDSNGIYQHNASGGSLEGSSLGMNSAGSTGATFDTGTGGINFQDFEGGFAGTIGTIQLFSIQGTGSGSINSVNGSVRVGYEFTLTTTPGFSESAIRPAAVLNPLGPTVTAATLSLSVTTDAGTFNQDIALGATGTAANPYQGFVFIPVNGTTLQSYSAVLTAQYEIGSSGDGFEAGFTATVPMFTSIDFTEVPEPSTWVILATGVAGAGLQVMRVRQRRAKAAPTAA